MIRYILCDIGEVLVKVHFDSAMDRFQAMTGLSQEELERRIFTSGLKEQHDLGLISSESFYEQVMGEGLIPFSSFKLIWSEIFSEKDGVIDCLASYQNTHQLNIASNTDPLHLAYLRQTFPWFLLFTGFGVSFRLHRVKPSPQFFIELGRSLDIPLTEAVFIDDRPENVVAAQSLGLMSHRFSDLTSLKAFLERYLK